MPNNNDDKKLLLYISISIILHFLVIYFLPIGFLHGSAQSESELNDYGYVQLVDYQPSSLETETTEKEAESTKDLAEKEPEKIEEEVKESKEDSIPEKTVEKEIAKPEPEVEPEIIEEKIEETEEVIDPEPEISVEPEPVSEPEPTPEPEVEETKEEILASEESESEVEIIQEETSQNEVVEEEKNSTLKEKDKEIETEAAKEDITKNNEVEQIEQEEESVPPPPPPTSGDLIGLIEPPTFPKDLVGSRSEGKVRLLVKISPGGLINNIEIVKSSGHDSMDRVAQLTLEHGWDFKEYQHPYQIPVSVNYYIDDLENTQVEVEIGEVHFISGGE